MDPSEVVILCGEWETGPAPQISSGEKYNIPLEISEIVRHPDFDAADSGVDGGSDIAVFKVSETSQAGSSEFDEHGVNPICLPEPSRPAPKEGVHSGWANPPPLHYFRDFGPGFLLFVTDTGINHFRDTFELTTGYCYNLSLAIATCDSDLEDGAPGCQRVLDPDADCPDFLRLPPFSTCKNDCPGGEH